MSSLNGYFSTLGDAKDTLGSTERQHALSTDARERLRNWLASDSYAFTELVCGHSDMRPEVHMLMSYAACGLTDKVAWLISQTGFDSFVLEQFRKQMQARQIDVRTAEGRKRLDLALDWQNWRVARGSFKSSVITHGGATFTATRDPNTTAKITHAKDEKAWEFCSQIADTLLSGVYYDIFPERVPEGNLKEMVTAKHITFGGRTISHPQTTIQAAGYTSKDIGGHYDTFWTDDLVVGGDGGNATPALLPGVHAWLRGIAGFHMITRRVRQIHVGTVYDENDDHAFLTRGNNALACLTVFVPIEVKDAADDNILKRGTPTMPTLLSPEKITSIQARVLSDEKDMDGAYSWRCNYLLDPSGAGGKMFPDRIVDDPERSYAVHPHPLAQKNPKVYKDRFLVSRVARDAEGLPTKQRMTFDPWRDLDRTLTLDPSWKDGGDNWGATVEGTDHEGVRFVLEVQAGNDGMQGWIEAIAELDAVYAPRVIGFGGAGMQDAMVKNIVATDPRMRKLRHKIVSLPEQAASKKARIKGGVAEPLRMFRLLLPPAASVNDEYDAGALIARTEMKAYKGDKNAVDGILDSMSMGPAVSRRKFDPEKRKEIAARNIAAERRYRQSIDPILGVAAA